MAQTMPTWGSPTGTTNKSVPVYPTTPAPLTSSEIATFDAQRRTATSNYQNAMNQRQAGTVDANQNYANAVALAARNGVQAEGAARDIAGGNGLAFSPAFVGKSLRGLAQDKADAVAGAQSDKAAKLAALDQMVNQAQLDRENTIGQVAAQEAQRRADLSRLIGGLA